MQSQPGICFMRASLRVGKLCFLSSAIPVLMRIIESLELVHHESLAMGTLANTGIKPATSAQSGYVYLSYVVKEIVPFDNQWAAESFGRRGWFYVARILFLDRMPGSCS